MARVEIAIGKADDGRTVTVRPGDTLVVRLDEVPTSGYRWEVGDLDSAILAADSDDFHPPPGDTMGGAGTRELRYRVVGPGTCRLTLNHRRSWDRDSTAESFELTIDAAD